MKFAILWLLSLQNLWGYIYNVLRHHSITSHYFPQNKKTTNLNKVSFEEASNCNLWIKKAKTDKIYYATLFALVLISTFYLRYKFLLVGNKEPLSSVYFLSIPIKFTNSRDNKRSRPTQIIINSATTNVVLFPPHHCTGGCIHFSHHLLTQMHSVYSPEQKKSFPSLQLEIEMKSNDILTTK